MWTSILQGFFHNNIPNYPLISRGSGKINLIYNTEMFLIKNIRTMNQYISNDTVRIILATAFFIGILVLIFFVYRFIFIRLKRKTLKTPGKLDDFMIDLLKIPALWLFYWVLLKIFTHLFLRSLPFFDTLVHINTLLLIVSIAWISIQSIKAGTFYLQRRLDIDTADNLNARKSLTQIKVFRGIVNTVIRILSIAIGLLTFEQVRNIGISLLTSAGIIGIIVGFAAQKSIGMILAGIQLAITQPVRLDDVVIVEGEWGENRRNFTDCCGCQNLG